MTNTEPGKKKGCGCIAKGCIIVLIVAAILAGMGVWFFKKGVEWARTQTSSGPVEVPVENATQDEYEALIKRLNAFKDAAPGSAQTLQLTAHDLNVLIAKSPEWKDVQSKIHVTIDNDQIGVMGSVPLTGLPLFGDQYLNGKIDFTLSMADGILHFKPQGIKLKDHEFSKEEMNKLGNDYPFKVESIKEPVLGPVLSSAKTLNVKDGVIVLAN